MIRIARCFSQTAIPFSSDVVHPSNVRVGVPCRRHGHIVRFVADINAGRVGMHDFQTEIFALDFPRHLSPLFAVHLGQLFCVGRQIAFLFFCGCLDFMLIFHGEFNSARPGRRPVPSLSNGVGPLFFSERRRHHLRNRQYRSHAPLSGRNAPETLCGLSCRVSLCLRF